MEFADSAGVALGSEAAYAQTSHETTGLTLEEPFVGRNSAVDWAVSITTCVAILIVIIVIFTAIFERRRLTPFAANLLRFTGLGVLPIVMMLLGGFATFEGTKRVEFCHSCHSAMNLYVDDMRNKQSTTLAALHYNNRYIQEEQCYRCHADYGVWGTIGAKATGLRHLYYWVTNAATARGTQQIKLYGTYRNDLCLHCHAGSQRFLKVENGLHTDIADDLLVKDSKTGLPKTSCLDCHSPVHPSLAGAKTTGKEGT